ncbi:MAG: IgGFc-binding protein, partial [Myxococcales bacterium]|nr:IgGFc-binding protein [Myxococcales bacterium]
MIGVLWMACAVDYGVQGPGNTPDLPPTLPPTVPIVEEPVSIDASTRGTGFWIGFMENIRLGTNGEPVFDVSAYADAPGTLTVSLPNTGYTDTVTVSPGWNDVALPASVLYAEGSDVVGRWGVRVESDVEVDLVAHHRRVFFSESSLVLPDGELGTRYRIQALAPPPDDTGRGGFVVVATEDGTTVELTLSDVSTAAFPAGSPYTVELDAGETYQVLSQGDLSGSLVTADAPVAVFAGGADTWAGCPATSHAWEQLAPVDRWGREHLVVPFAGQGGDLVRIVADGPTTVQLDCDETVELEEGGVWTGLATAPL